MRNQPYKSLAEHYDAFFTFHIDWYEAARRKILANVLTQARSACDLACGTGTTALLLAQTGIRMYGVDLSPAMCRIARAKAKKPKLPLRVLKADMRDFSLPEPVDLVLCEFDALNHVDRKADLARVARCVARALVPGGHFYFDVNNRAAFEKIWPGTWFVDQPNLALVLHGGYDRNRDKGWTTANWFMREKNGSWRRRNERLEQVSWTANEMRKTLREAGFDSVRAFDAVPFFKGDTRIEQGCRTFYLARKRRA